MQLAVSLLSQAPQLQGNARIGRLDLTRQPPTGYCGDRLSFRKAAPILFNHGDRGATDRSGIATAAVTDRCSLLWAGEETKKTGREKQWGCLGKRGGEKMERKEGQQERSQNIEENIPEAKNSILRHSRIPSLGLDRVDSGTEE